MEIPLRDFWHPFFVANLHVEWCGWDELGSEPAVERVRTSMTDFNSVRQVCRSWEEALEHTVEGASHRLARRDWLLEQKPWLFEEEFMRASFDRNYSSFVKSWKLQSEIVDDNLRLQPLHTLSDGDLEELHSILEVSGNVQIHVENCGRLEAAPGTWISPAHRY